MPDSDGAATAVEMTSLVRRSSAANSPTSAASPTTGYTRFVDDDSASSSKKVADIKAKRGADANQRDGDKDADDDDDVDAASGDPQEVLYRQFQRKRHELRMLFPLEGSMMLPRNVMQHVFQLQYIFRRYFFSVFGYEAIILLLLIGIASTTTHITSVIFFANIIALWRAGRHAVLTEVVTPFRCHIVCVLLLLAYTMLGVGVPPDFVDAPPMAGSRSCADNGGVNWWAYLGCNVPLTDEIFLFFAVVLLRLAYLGADARRPLIDRRVQGFRTLGEFFLDKEQDVEALRSGARDDADAVLPPLPHDVLMQPRTLPESLVSVYFGFFPTAILAFFHGVLETSVVSISEMLLGLCLIVYATDIYWTFYRWWGKVTGLLLVLVSVQLLSNLPPVFLWAKDSENVAFSIGVAPWSFQRVGLFAIVLQVSVVWSAFVQDRIFNEFFFAWKLQSLHKGSILAFRRHQQLMVHMQDQSREQEMLAATKEAQLIEKLEKIRAQRFGKKGANLLLAGGGGGDDASSSNANGMLLQRTGSTLTKQQQQQQQEQPKAKRTMLDTSSDDDGANSESMEHEVHPQSQQQQQRRKSVAFQPTQIAAREALIVTGVATASELPPAADGKKDGNNKTATTATKGDDDSAEQKAPEVTFAERWAAIRLSVEAKFTEFLLTGIELLSEHSYTGRRPGLHYHITTRFVMAFYKFLVRRTGDITVLAFVINFAASGSLADMFLCISGLVHALVVLPWSSEAYWEGALIYTVFSILVKSAIKICAENIEMSAGTKTAISVMFLDLGVTSGEPVKTAALVDIVFDFFVFGCILLHRRLCVQNGVYVAGGESQSAKETEEQIERQMEAENRKLIDGGDAHSAGKDAPPGARSATDPKSVPAIPLAAKLIADEMDEGENDDENADGNKHHHGDDDEEDADGDDEDGSGREPKSMAELAAQRESEQNGESGDNKKGAAGGSAAASISGPLSRCLKSTRRVSARIKRGVTRFVHEMQGNVSKRSGSGRDFYTLYLTVDFLVLIYVMFSYYSLIGTVRGSFLEGLQQNLLPGPLVCTMLGLVLSMIVDRVIYVTGSMQAKYLFHIFQACMIHAMYCGWKVWFNSPYIGSGVTLYLIKVLYLYVSCAQIRFGFAAHRRHDPFTEEATLFYWLGHVIYRAVPFLWELRVLLDWSFARTALRLKAWWLIEDVHYWIYSRFTDIDDDRTTNPTRGSSFPVFVRIAHGLSLFVGIVFILFFPLMYYSTFNPNLVPNRVNVLTARMSLSQVTEIYDSTELGYLDEEFQAFKRVLGDTRPSLQVYLRPDDDTRTTQVVDLASCSASLWSVSPYTRQQLLLRIERGVQKLDELRLRNVVGDSVAMLDNGQLDDKAAQAAAEAARRAAAAAAAAAANRSGGGAGAGAGVVVTPAPPIVPAKTPEQRFQEETSAAYLEQQAQELQAITKYNGVFFVDLNVRVVRSGSTGGQSNDVTLQRRVALPEPSLKRLYNIVSRSDRYPHNETRLPPLAEEVILKNTNISFGVPFDPAKTIWIPAAWDPFLLNRPTGVATFSETSKDQKNLMGCLLMHYSFGASMATQQQQQQQQNPNGGASTNSSGGAAGDGGAGLSGNNTTPSPTAAPASTTHDALADLLSQESWCLRCEALFNGDTIQPRNLSNHMCDRVVSRTTAFSSTVTQSVVSESCNFEQYPPVNSSFPGLYFVAISEPIPSEGGFLPNVGIIALYTTFILTLFTVMRRKFTLSSQRVTLEEVADPRPVAELVSYIYLTRSVGGENDLVLEELLYFELLDLVRSPEALLKLTGRRVQDYDPTTHAYTRSIEVNF